MPVAVKPRLRVLAGANIALGPGKVALLDAIEEHGTLAGDIWPEIETWIDNAVGSAGLQPGAGRARA